MSERSDEDLMRQALDLGAGARSTTSPRPWVGAVIDPGGFAGATTGRTGPHAEIVALEAAGEAARGATLAVTLEPCCHHGTTPPCTDAIIAAGISRVVSGVEDPDPKVAGKGHAALRAAGIEVVTGVLEQHVTDQLAPYLHHRRTGRPYVVVKLGATLDGRTAAPDGSSQWITGPNARTDVHRIRAESDAILVGAATVRVDDPSLTVRLGEDDAADHDPEHDPLRVVLGEIPPGARVEPALSWTGPLDGLLDELGGRGVLQLVVEGGAATAAAFHEAGLVDRYVVYLAPAIFGGDAARPMFAGTAAPTIDELWRGRFVSVERLGEDVRIEVVPRPVVPGRRDASREGDG
jgi:diaminohydroxyphosphoribosylaminopyrimidine deaminase/5-amino-6-(5-phosphoribosylamino)uracil reductase